MPTQPETGGASAPGGPQRKYQARLTTLLFTDMVGFAGLKQELGDVAAAEIVARHDEILRELLARYPTGREIETAGDSFFVVFEVTSDAVRFALQFQAALRRYVETAPRAIEVRMGIHAGEVLMQETARKGGGVDFFGIHVDTAARVMSICPGGRILLTRFALDNAKQALKGQAVDGVGDLEWTQHGWFRIKGVAEPVELFEVGETSGPVPLPLEASEKVEPVEGLVGTAEAAWPAGPSAGLPVTRVERLQQAVRERWRDGLWGALVVLGATLLALALAPRTFSDLSYDLSYLVRPEVRPTDVLMVYMDDVSRKEFKLDDAPTWDRALHARLIDRLTADHARAIVFDVIFDVAERGRNQPEADRLLMEAVRKSGRVFLGAEERPVIRDGRHLGSAFNGPFSELRKVAAWGLVEHVPQAEAVKRTHSRSSGEARMLAEVVAEAAAQRRLGPATRQRWMNFYGPPLALPHASYRDALDPEALPGAAISNKVVFVGARLGLSTPLGMRIDEVATPYSRWTGALSPGVDLTATAYLNLVRSDWLEQVSPWAELGLFLGCGLLAGFLLALVRPVLAVAVAVGVALWLGVAVCLLVWRTHSWFSWATVSFVQLPVAAGWSGLAQTRRLQREKLVWQRAAAKRTATRAYPGPAVSGRSAPSALPATTPDPALAIPNYTLLRTIGSGAYGQVWLVRDVVGSFQAIKIVRRASFKSREPYDREFRGVQKFSPISRSHPNLINILHVGRHDRDGFFYYAMEAADDERAGSAIRPEAYAPRTLSKDLGQGRRRTPAEALDLGIALAGALTCLHEHGLIHRDIKPANILFVRGDPKLADIGLVADLAQTGDPPSLVGTLGYLAPEGPGTAAADLYSLGKVLYEVAMGRRVDAFPELPSEWPGPAEQAGLLGLNDLILKACAPDPRARWASAAEFRQALVRLRQSLDGPSAHA